jgi:hypothetical protein
MTVDQQQILLDNQSVVTALPIGCALRARGSTGNEV